MRLTIGKILNDVEGLAFSGPNIKRVSLLAGIAVSRVRLAGSALGHETFSFGASIC